MKSDVVARIVQLAVQHDQLGSYTETDEEGNEVDNDQFLELFGDLIDQVEQRYFEDLVALFRSAWKEAGVDIGEVDSGE